MVVQAEITLRQPCGLHSWEPEQVSGYFDLATGRAHFGGQSQDLGAVLATGSYNVALVTETNAGVSRPSTELRGDAKHTT